MLLATAFEDSTTATKVQPIILMPLLLFSGFFVNLDSIPVFLRWIQYLSFFKYSFQGTAWAVFYTLTLNCTWSELKNFTVAFNVTVPVDIGGSFINLTETIQRNISVCPVTNGTQILDQLGLKYHHIWLSLLFLAICFLVFHTFAFIFLGFLRRNK